MSSSVSSRMSHFFLYVSGDGSPLSGPSFFWGSHACRYGCGILANGSTLSTYMRKENSSGTNLRLLRYIMKETDIKFFFMDQDGFSLRINNPPWDNDLNFRIQFHLNWDLIFARMCACSDAFIFHRRTRAYLISQLHENLKGRLRLFKLYKKKLN